jgi:hypothetical protein
MEAQMALAKGGLAVPLKIFTIVTFGSDKKPPMRWRKSAVTLTTTPPRASGISD